jgi:hypothetical protein
MKGYIMFVALSIFFACSRNGAKDEISRAVLPVLRQENRNELVVGLKNMQSTGLFLCDGAPLAGNIVLYRKQGDSFEDYTDYWDHLLVNSGGWHDCKTMSPVTPQTIDSALMDYLIENTTFLKARLKNKADTLSLRDIVDRSYMMILFLPAESETKCTLDISVLPEGDYKVVWGNEGKSQSRVGYPAFKKPDRLFGYKKYDLDVPRDTLAFRR